MTKSELRTLQFIKDHPGGKRSPAFPCGERFRFNTPELKRAPFRYSTLRRCIDHGLVTASGDVALTPKGEHELASHTKTPTSTDP